MTEEQFLMLKTEIKTFENTYSEHTDYSDSISGLLNVFELSFLNLFRAKPTLENVYSCLYDNKCNHVEKFLFTMYFARPEQNGNIKYRIGEKSEFYLIGDKRIQNISISKNLMQYDIFTKKDSELDRAE
ncbi:hypothetical protein QA601_17895 [Chitinispirillales bacterium ANBcel5]|uniref:hypothetical protein n=1 Tax=Cellulosispirillum alkaliphilum TaxID=3039283 RepID=UPI002A5805D5|nr:hypothetical protein [Chitinispirillales bacterium ANBcel5]